MRKGDWPKNGWYTGVSVLRAFKLDHLQPVERILSQNIPTFFTFILGAPISYYPRERKRGSSRGWKWGKGIHPIMNETGVSVPGAFKLGHLQPVKLILISVPRAFKLDPLQPVKLILNQNHSTYLILILGGPIPYFPRERKRGSSRGRKWEKGFIQ